MPLTTLDPRTALVVVDLQAGIVGMPGLAPHPAGAVVARSAELATAFRRHGLPVVLVNVAGGPGGRTDQGGGTPMTLPPESLAFAPELDQQPGDKVVTKRTRGAFHATDLAAYLAERGVTQVVITGIATGAGVLVTALEAHQHGLNVTLPVDAMTDRSAEVHDFNLAQVFPKVGETGTTADVLSLLETARA